MTAPAALIKTKKGPKVAVHAPEHRTLKGVTFDPHPADALVVIARAWWPFAKGVGAGERTYSERQTIVFNNLLAAMTEPAFDMVYMRSLTKDGGGTMSPMRAAMVAAVDATLVANDTKRHMDDGLIEKVIYLLNLNANDAKRFHMLLNDVEMVNTVYYLMERYGLAADIATTVAAVLTQLTRHHDATVLPENLVVWATATGRTISKDFE